jgi:UDP-N-acetylmuramyl tripeptide synthase
MPLKHDVSGLTARELAAIDRKIPLHEVGKPFDAPRQTIQEFLENTRAGQKEIDAWVAEMVGDFNAQLAAASSALMDAGASAEQIVALAQGFAAATPDVRDQVIALLVPKQ